MFDPSDNMVVKKKRGRMSNAAKALALAQQEAQDAAKPVVKEHPKDPNRTCSLCSRDKQEALTACRDCTVRGENFFLISIFSTNIKWIIHYWSL